MATNTGCETTGCSFQWKIENISHCWDSRVCSPVFTADALKGTKWMLIFCPDGENRDNKLKFFLRKEEDIMGDKNISRINYMLTFVDKEGSILQEINGLSTISLKTRERAGFLDSLPRNRVFVTERELFLPEDTLTVQCTLWEMGEKPVNIHRVYGRTNFKVNRRSFLRRMEKFSTLNPGLQGKFEDDLLKFEFVLNDGHYFRKKLGMKVTVYSGFLKYLSFKVSVLDSAGRKEKCGTHEYFDRDLSREVLYIPLFSKEIMKNKNHYLPNDVLTLYYEYVYSNGASSNEYCDFLMVPSESTNASINDRCIVKEESKNTFNLVRDLKCIYNKGHFCNILLRTSTKTFAAHKVILSARSPVFRKMFVNDRKEANCGYVDITHFEDDTIQRMLLYMYTDSLEDLDFVNATKLYKIAHMYKILSLKSRCSSFLKDNLCPSNACDILMLANLHNDDNLKCATQDYILEQNKQFFCSPEWKFFLKTHTEIAADVICRKIHKE